MRSGAPSQLPLCSGGEWLQWPAVISSPAPPRLPPCLPVRACARLRARVGGGVCPQELSAKERQSVGGTIGGNIRKVGAGGGGGGVVGARGQGPGIRKVGGC